MEIKMKSYSNQSSLISSIIFFIIGGILFTSADAVIGMLTKVLGIGFAFVGVIEIIVFGLRNKEEESYISELIKGIILIVLSLIFIFASDLIEQIIRLIIGAWILFTGINRLINVLSMGTKSNKFLSLLIVSLLLIAIGVYTIIIGDVVLTTIGLLIMIYAAIDIIGYIVFVKDKIETEKEGSTTLIVPDKTEKKPRKKAKNVKDTKAIETSENEEK